MEESLIGSYNFSVLREILDGFNLLQINAGIEVGVFDGGTSQYLLKSFPALRLFSVDPYKLYNEYDAERLAQAEAMSFRRLSPFAERSIRIKEDSLTAAALLPDDSFDFVFIDADHSYEAVKKDMEAWYPKIRRGGLFSGHDYRWEGVARAVHEFSEERGNPGYFTPPASDIWWFIKPA